MPRGCIYPDILRMRKFVYITIAIMSLFCSCADAKVKQYKIDVVKEYRHDETSYTQGLFFYKGRCMRAPVNGANPPSVRSI